MAKRALAPKSPAFAAGKPGDSLPSLLRPPHREPSKSIAPTPIHPSLPSVIRICGVAVGRLACRKRQEPILRNIAENRTLVRCLSVSISQ